MKSYSLS